MAAKDGDKLRITAEVADLWFHCLVLLARARARPRRRARGARAARGNLGENCREGPARKDVNANAGTACRTAGSPGKRRWNGCRDCIFLQDRAGRNSVAESLRGRRDPRLRRTSNPWPRCISCLFRSGTSLLWPMPRPTTQVWLGRIMALTGRLAREQGSPDGYRTIVNTGRIGGRMFMHLHVHVIGRAEAAGPHGCAHPRLNTHGRENRMGSMSILALADRTGGSSC